MPLTTTEPAPAAGLGLPQPFNQAPVNQAGRNNLLQLVQLRWLAVAGQLGTILAVHYALGIHLPVREMLTLLAVLAAFNMACWLRSRTEGSREGISNGELFAGLMVDVAVLSGQLFYSGGITNPFIFLFLLQVALGAVLLSPRYIWTMVAVTGFCFTALTQWHWPLRLPDLVSLSLSTHYVGGLLICFGLNAVWEVDVFGSRHSDAEMVRQLMFGAQEQQHGAQLLVASDIASHYFEARGAERRLILLQQGVTVARRLHQYAEGRFKAGQTTASEVDRAGLQVDYTESQIEPLKALLQSHIRRIAVLMGRAPETLTSLPPQPASFHLPTALPEVMPSDVLERRPDVRGAARKVRSQAAKLGSAKAELFPKFYIGFGGMAGRMHPDSMEGNNFSVQSLGIGMRLPLLEGGRIRANIAVNQAQLEGVAAQYEQAVLTALEDVENAFTAKKAFDARYDKLSNSARLARKVAEHKQALFVSGSELLQPALEAEATALQREDETIQGDVSRALYTVLLYKALGGGWSTQRDNWPLPAVSPKVATATPPLPTGLEGL